MKDKIINRAKKMFIDFGFKSVTMDDIASKMGISKKTIYKYFDNKTQLVEACVDIIFKEISKGVEEVCAEIQNPIEELYSIEEFVVEYIDEKDHAKSHQLKKYYPELHQKIEKGWFENLQICMRENIERGKELGLYRDEVDIDFAIGIYFSGMSSTCNDDIFNDSEVKKNELIFKFLEYHVRAISTGKGLKKLKTIINK